MYFLTQDYSNIKGWKTELRTTITKTKILPTSKIETKLKQI